MLFSVDSLIQHLPALPTSQLCKHPGKSLWCKISSGTVQWPSPGVNPVGPLLQLLGWRSCMFDKDKSWPTQSPGNKNNLEPKRMELSILNCFPAAPKFILIFFHTRFGHFFQVLLSRTQPIWPTWPAKTHLAHTPCSPMATQRTHAFWAMTLDWQMGKHQKHAKTANSLDFAVYRIYTFQFGISMKKRQLQRKLLIDSWGNWAVTSSLNK